MQRTSESSIEPTALQWHHGQGDPLRRGLARIAHLQAFCTWKLESHPSEAKPRKVPYIRGGRRLSGSYSDPGLPRNLYTLEEALAVVHGGGYNGVGLVFYPECGYVGVDLDHVVDEGRVSLGEAQKRAWSVVHPYAYKEVSQSRSGLHAVVLGSAATMKANGEVEVFGDKNFLALTGLKASGEAKPLPASELMALGEAVRSVRKGVVAIDGDCSGVIVNDCAGINDDLLVHAAPQMPPTRDADAAAIERECAQVGRLARHGGENYEHWFGAFGLARCCADGREVAHRWSRNHPGYTEAETDRKLASWDHGPTTCEYFERSNPGGCSGCSHKGKIKSPIVLGTVKNAPVVPAWIAEKNERFAQLRFGSSVNIVAFRTPIQTLVGLRYGVGYLTIEAFRQLHRGQYTPNTEEGRASAVADAWLSHACRRRYEGHAFAPGERLPHDILNLWQGFGVEPEPGNVDPWLSLRDRLIPDVAARCYLTNWIAKKVQEPGYVPDTIIIVRGPKGVGKNSLFDPIVAMFGPHGMVADDAEQIAGRFTGHLQDKAFAVLDEALFVGDSKQADRIKSRVTAKVMSYEAKGRDPVQGINRCAFVSLTNHTHVWQATVDERRAVVIEASNVLQGDHQFWNRYHAWMRSGGVSHLLHYLQRVDTSGFNPRVIPRSDALRAQVEQTALRNPAVAWWHQCLSDGAIRWRESGVERSVSLDDGATTDVGQNEFRESFCQFAQRFGRTGSDWPAASRSLRAWGNFGKKRSNGPRGREWVTIVPPASELRRAFTAATGVGFSEEF